MQNNVFGRREVLRWAGVSAVAAVAGCFRSPVTRQTPPESPERTEPAIRSTDSATPKSCRQGDEDSPTTSATARPVYVDDLIVQNVGESDQRVTVSVVRRDNSETGNGTIFNAALDVRGEGGGKKFEEPIFETEGTYQVTVIVESTEHTTQKEISVTDSHWRRYNGVMVSIESSERIEIRTLHGDPPPTTTECSR